MKTTLIVIDEHTLATHKPNSLYANVLAASVLKGSPIADPLSAMEPIIIAGKTVRLASRQDFENFRVSFKGFDNSDEFEFNDH